MKTTIFAVFALIFTVSARAETLGFSLSGGPSAGKTAVTVLDDSTGATLDGAKVDVTTAADGSSTIHVARDGYAEFTLIGARSAAVTVSLKLLDGGDTVLASGSMSPWAAPTGSTLLHFGLVFRSLGALDLLHFDSDAVISPLKDNLDVMGPHDVPSNLLIPDQDVPVFFTSVHVSKPSYRLPVPRGRAVRLAGVMGDVDVGDILPDLQSGNLSIGMLSHVNFTRVGLSDPAPAAADFTQDVAASTRLEPAYQVTTNPAPFESSVIVAALSDISGDRQVLLPTDIKPGGSDPVTLSAPASRGESRMVMTVAVAPHGARLTGILSADPGRSVSPGDFIGADDLSSVQQLPASVELQAPAHGVAALVLEGAAGAVGYVYALPGAGAVSAPTALSASAHVRGLSVLQLEFSSFDEGAIDGAAVMRDLTRFSRATAKFAQ
jgi:hypothetical protein